MATKKPPASKKKPAAKKAAPVKTQPKPEAPLSELEEAFSNEYIVDLNATQAYLRVKPGVKETTASAEASKLLGKPKVQERIAKLKADRAERTGITADAAVREAWAIMTADPRELMEYRIGACRYCWGKGFRYQRTDAEYEQAERNHAAQLANCDDAKQRKKLGAFDAMGGPGFNRNRAPNTACPCCGGEGEGRTIFKDTRTISPAAASLFAGVKETKEGLEFKLHSKDAAMDKMFRHLGLYNDKIQLTMPSVLVKDLTGRKD